MHEKRLLTDTIYRYRNVFEQFRLSKIIIHFRFWHLFIYLRFRLASKIDQLQWIKMAYDSQIFTINQVNLSIAFKIKFLGWQKKNLRSHLTFLLKAGRAIGQKPKKKKNSTPLEHKFCTYLQLITTIIYFRAYHFHHHLKPTHTRTALLLGRLFTIRIDFVPKWNHFSKSLHKANVVAFFLQHSTSFRWKINWTKRERVCASGHWMSVVDVQKYKYVVVNNSR